MVKILVLSYLVQVGVTVRDSYILDGMPIHVCICITNERLEINLSAVC